MNQVRSCGVLVMRRQPESSFLLMRHVNRWDLPKGHVDAGETDLECALRELHEETGIQAGDIDLDNRFQFEIEYDVCDKRFPGEIARKTLRIYLGWLGQDVAIQPSEHLGFEWFKWQPPHTIQTATIDPLLAAVEEHFKVQA
jgi:8-oxo-dGTP pyrophosphatase MutT (NUDIX family)